jgi:hypothetical protein
MTPLLPSLTLTMLLFLQVIQVNVNVFVSPSEPLMWLAKIGDLMALIAHSTKTSFHFLTPMYPGIRQAKHATA